MQMMSRVYICRLLDTQISEISLRFLSSYANI